MNATTSRRQAEPLWMLASRLSFKASVVNGSGAFWHSGSAWIPSTCQHHSSGDCSAWTMQEKASWDPNSYWSPSWISLSVWRVGEKKKRLLPLMLITTPQSKPNNTKWKPQRAHLWWLHYDICWRLCDVHGLHLPPLFFDCLSCTRNMADRR